MVFLVDDAEYARRHKSIIAYLSSHDLPETASALRNELGMAETDFDATAVKKYETLLEKKWTSTVRLQKKASRNCGLRMLRTGCIYYTGTDSFIV